MIDLIEGAPGAGKTADLMITLANELVTTQRNIATNAPILWKELFELLDSRHGQRFGAAQRIRVLTNFEVLEFWNHPKIDLDIEDRHIVATGKVWSTKEKKRISLEEDRPDFSRRGCVLDFVDGVYIKNPDYRGTLFMLDEGQEFFNSRNWQYVTGDLIFYIGQHRKLSDDVRVYTPNKGWLDKQFRDACQTTTVFRNLKYETFGLFNLPNKIIFSKYLGGNTQGKAMFTGWRSLDIPLLNCYDSSQGAGIVGAAADKGTKRAGMIPWWLIIVIMVGVFVGIWFGLTRLMKGFKNDMKAPISRQSGPRQNVPVVPVASPLVQPVAEKIVLPGRQKESLQIETEKKEDEIYMIGYASSGGVQTVYLSNGMVLETGMRGFQFASQEIFLFDGKVISRPPFGWVRTNNSQNVTSRKNQNAW